MSKTCVGLLCAVAIVLMCAPAATADPVRIVSYDVEQTAESGFGGWSHVYDGAVTDTGRRLGGSASCDPPRPPAGSSTRPAVVARSTTVSCRRAWPRTS